MLHDSHVVAPRNVSDVAETLRTARETGCAVSTAGVASTDRRAVELNLSVYLNRVVQVDPGGRFIRAQAGALLSDVRAAAVAHGRAFLPSLTLSGRMTIGAAFDDGLLVHPRAGADAEPLVLDAGVVLYGGAHYRSQRYLEQTSAYADVLALRDRVAGAIRRELGRRPWQIVGPHLAALLHDEPSIVRALGGSRGTAVVTTELTCALEAALPARACVVFAFAGAAEAAAHVPFVQSYDPATIYGCDAAALQQGPFADMVPAGMTILIAEFACATVAEACEAAQALAEAERHRFAPVDARVVAAALADTDIDAVTDRHPPDFFLSSDVADLSALLAGVHAAAAEAVAAIAVHGDFGGPRVGISIVRAPNGARTAAGLFHEALRLAVKHRGLAVAATAPGTAAYTVHETLYGPELAQAMAAFSGYFDPAGALNPAATHAS